MKNLGQKIERIDNATDDIMDEIGNYFWTKHDIDICEFYPNHDDKISMSDKIYSIIHNKLKEII